MSIPSHLLRCAHEPVREDGELDGVKFRSNLVRLAVSNLDLDVAVLGDGSSAARFNQNGANIDMWQTQVDKVNIIPL